ncbi:VMAP-C domain-containing protein [Streptomyces sp. 7N604]|uniref:VMAP-C domain-containing protein n=1 Tax=Streptomyces sp. 7N604 TaxID=3457415 RepID=UPI003FD3D9D8
MTTGTDGAPWRVRVLDRDGRVVGAGLLISGESVLTCAHVVAEASSLRPVQDRPTGAVRVDLPALHEERVAEVLPGGWFPAQPRGLGDVAVLALRGPAVRCEPLPRLRLGASPGPGTRVTFYGFPAGIEHGIWVSARVSPSPSPGPGPGPGPGPNPGPAPQWQQLDIESPTQLGPGFSGAAVVSSESGDVVGMVAASTRGPDRRRTVFMLPVDGIAEHWPLLAAPAVGGAAGAGRLSARDAGTMVEALMGLPDLSDRRFRSVYADILDDRTGSRPRIGLSDDTRQELWALIDWCVRSPDAVHELLETIRSFHPASVEVDRLAERIERVVPPPLLTTGERHDLMALAGRCRHPNPEALVRDVTAVRPLPGGDTRDLPTVFRLLEDAIAAPDGVHPLAAFTARLAESQGTELRRELSDWIDGFVRRTGMPRPRPRTEAVPSAGSARPAAMRSHLTIQLEEDGLDPHRYLLSVWLQEGDREVRALYRADEALALPEARRRVDEAISGGGIRAPADDLWIEFILPLALLDAPLEQWTLGITGAPEVPIGAEYPVVVRSLDRLRDPTLHTKWRRLWSRAKDGPAAGALHIAHGDRQELQAAIQEGLPVIAWMRDSKDPVAADALRDLLGGAPLARLPVLVRDVRSAAFGGVGSPGHPGHGVRLLYDDPDRTPEQMMRLQVPEPAGETG